MGMLHPKILEKNKKEEFAILPYDEFLKIQEELDDYESLKVLREAKAIERGAQTVSLAEVQKKFGRA